MINGSNQRHGSRFSRGNFLIVVVVVSSYFVVLFFSCFQLMKVVSVWNILKTQNSDSQHGTKLHNPTHQKNNRHYLTTPICPFLHTHSNYHKKNKPKIWLSLTNGGFAPFFFLFSSTKITARTLHPTKSFFYYFYHSFHRKFLLHVVAMFVVSCGGDHTRGKFVLKMWY